MFDIFVKKLKYKNIRRIT